MTLKTASCETRTSRLAFVWILLSIFLQASAALFSKKAAMVGQGEGLAASLFTPWYLGTISFLGLQAFTWIMALREYPLAFAYPFMSVVRGLVLLGAWVFFLETIDLHEVIGMGFIMMGIIIIGTKVDL